MDDTCFTVTTDDEKYSFPRSEPDDADADAPHPDDVDEELPGP